MLKFNTKPAFKVVNADCFGEGFQVRVCEKRIKHEVQLSFISNYINDTCKAKGQRLMELQIAAQLMAVTCDNNTGEFLFTPSDIEYFADNAPATFLSELMLANKEINPSSYVEPTGDTLNGKKNNT